MSYSQPVEGEMNLNELRPHLHYRKDLPDAIPYRTSYYQENWGFCLSYEQYKSLEKDGGPFICTGSFVEESNGSCADDFDDWLRIQCGFACISSAFACISYGVVRMRIALPALVRDNALPMQGKVVNLMNSDVLLLSMYQACCRYVYA